MKSTLLSTIALLLISIQTTAQDMRSNFIALSVKDISTQQVWYCNNLGFKVKKAVETVAPGIKFSLLDGNGMMIELIEDQKSEGKVTKNGNAAPHGIFKFGFQVADIDQLVSTLKLKGINPKYGPFKESGSDPKNVIFEDPEGNLIQFMEGK